MKKYLMLAVCIIALSATGCGKKANKTETTPTPVPTEKVEIVENGAIGAVKEDGKVKVSMPAKIMGEDTEAAAQSVKEAHGFESAEVKGDTVVFTMTTEQHKKWLLDTAENTKKSADELLKNFAVVTGVEFNKDFTNVKIKVNSKEYKADRDKVLAEGLANMMFAYQSMNGVKKENLKASASFVDATTGETVDKAEISGNK